MKKYFNKSIFKDKSFIKMVCFTIVLLLVLVLGNSFGYVSADGDGLSCLWLNYEDYLASDVYDISNVNVRYMAQSENAIVGSNAFFGIDFQNEVTDFTYAGGFNWDDIKYYVVVGNAYPSAWTIYLFTCEPTTVLINDVDAYNFWMWLPNESWVYKITVSAWGTGTTLTSPYVVCSPSVTRENPNYNPDNQLYFISYSGRSSDVICYSNTHIYTSQNSGIGNYADYKAFINNQPNDIVDVNYLYGDALPLSGFDNLEGIGDGDGIIGNGDSLSGQAPDNSMYVDSCDWVMNNYSSDIINNWKTISVMFTSNLNDYIRENYDNEDLEDFYITYDFVVDVYFYYYALEYNDIGSGDISFAKGLVTIGYNAPINTVSTDKFKFACTYKKSDANSPLSQSVSNFIDAGNSHVWSLNTLFPLLTPSGKLVIDYDQDQDPSNNNGTHYEQDIEFTLPELMSKINDGQLRLNNNSFSSFKLTCKASINYGNQATNEAIYTSGNYTETFDLLTGESTIDDSSMLTNYNPYNSNTAESYDVIPSSSSGSSTSSASTGNVTQTVTVTNSGSEYIPSLVNKLLPTSLGDTGTGLVDTFATMVQSNGWIAVMASTVPAIPAEMWTYMTTYLSITLYLLACAFVLRLILDLL